MAYRYARSSTLTDGPRPALQLATSGGDLAGRPVLRPTFFDGELRWPQQTARALAVVGKVARTRFYRPPGMIAAALRAADPVASSDGSSLRFESLSACCGVYARLDVLPDCLDETLSATGTTNVDINEPLQVLLAAVGPEASLRLRVGDGLELSDGRQVVEEERVPLPNRWLRGLGEVHVISARLAPLVTVTPADIRRLLRALPAPSTTVQQPLWVVPGASGLRVSSRPASRAMALAGGERLRVIEPLLRFAHRVRVYAQPGSAAADATQAAAGTSAWVLDLNAARVTVLLSPSASRGFSGEGGVLFALADERSQDDADLVQAVLAYDPATDLGRLAAETGLDPHRVGRALERLAAAGRIGYDLAEGEAFHRELPYDADVVAAMHPRLRDAMRLAQDGAVQETGTRALVRSGDAAHVVGDGASGPTCTCPWYAEHGLGRGPCKHILAVVVVRSRA